jgi:uncharacterized membrane protein YjjB (DUF3815 family)
MAVSEWLDDWQMKLLYVSVAFLATVGYAVLYSVPKKALLAVGLVGTVAWTAQDLALRVLEFSSIGAAFVGSLTVAVASEVLARRMQMPVIVFVVGGIVTLVPGSAAYATMRQVVTGQYLEGFVRGTETFLIASAISAGLVIAGTIMRMNRRSRRAGKSARND